MEAETYCRENFNGHLLAINSREEDDFIRARLLDEHMSGGWWWIGLTKAEGSWNWTSGEDVTYFNWADGEPNDSGDHAGIWGFPDVSWLEWDDIFSINNHNIICESIA